jgi:hypothetical protein
MIKRRKRKMKRYFKFVLLLGICLIFLTGCIVDLVVPENDSSSPTQEDGVVPGKGTLKIYLTDALEKNDTYDNYDAILISISRIEAHFVETYVEQQDAGVVGGSIKGNWPVIAQWDEGYEVDLIELEGKSILLASEQLLPGKYTQLRVFLKAQAIIIVNGEEHDLDIPSVEQTGIKLNHPFEITSDQITELTLDFDAEKSVIKTGNGKYKMKPVISLSSETYSTEELQEVMGSVSGTVSYYESDEGALALAGIGGANIELSGGAYIFGNTTITLEDGSFSLDNVPAGSYILNVYAESFDDYSQSIEVIAGPDTEVDVVLLSGGISGSVVVSGTTLAIEGATVNVELVGDSYSSFAITDTEGSFSLGQLPVGSYDLIVSASGYYDSDLLVIDVIAGGVIDIGVIGLTSQ